MLGVFVFLDSSSFFLSVETFQEELCEILVDFVGTFNQDLIFSYGGKW